MDFTILQLSALEYCYQTSKYFHTLTKMNSRWFHNVRKQEQAETINFVALHKIRGIKFDIANTNGFHCSSLNIKSLDDL